MICFYMLQFDIGAWLCSSRRTTRRRLCFSLASANNKTNSIRPTSTKFRNRTETACYCTRLCHIQAGETDRRANASGTGRQGYVGEFPPRRPQASCQRCDRSSRAQSLPHSNTVHCLHYAPDCRFVRFITYGQFQIDCNRCNVWTLLCSLVLMCTIHSGLQLGIHVGLGTCRGPHRMMVRTAT